MKKYVFCYWEVNPITLMRIRYEHKTIYADNVVNACGKMNDFVNSEYWEYMMHEKQRYTVQCSRNGWVFDFLKPFPTKIEK